LNEVRKQWLRIVFMLTNKEDVGKRMLEIMIPAPKNIKASNKYSAPFKTYYKYLEKKQEFFH